MKRKTYLRVPRWFARRTLQIQEFLEKADNPPGTPANQAATSLTRRELRHMQEDLTDLIYALKMRESWLGPEVVTFGPLGRFEFRKHPERNRIIINDTLSDWRLETLWPEDAYYSAAAYLIASGYEDIKGLLATRAGLRYAPSRADAADRARVMAQHPPCEECGEPRGMQPAACVHDLKARLGLKRRD